MVQIEGFAAPGFFGQMVGVISHVTSNSQATSDVRGGYLLAAGLVSQNQPDTVDANGNVTTAGFPYSLVVSNSVLSAFGTAQVPTNYNIERLIFR